MKYSIFFIIIFLRAAYRLLLFISDQILLFILNTLLGVNYTNAVILIILPSNDVILVQILKANSSYRKYYLIKIHLKFNK